MAMPQGMPPMPGVPMRTSGLAIAGFVCSFFCSLLGLILSILGYNECAKSNGAVKGKGFAIAGMVISGTLFIVGILAAIAIPAFIQYMNRAKRTEAPLQLNRIGRSAKMFYAENGKLPAFDQPLTPAEPCCTQANGKCAPSADDWSAPAWRAIDFSVDENHLFQYSYQSDGDTLEATAVGDPGCNGHDVTYHLHMRVENGVPTMQVDSL